MNINTAMLSLSMSIIRFLLRLTRYFNRKLARLDRKIHHGRIPWNQQKERVIFSTRHDMMTYPDEPYYREQYWYWISRALDETALASSAACLDLGCGQGRLSIPLAKKFREGKVFSVDFSQSAIDSARHYAAESRLTNINFNVDSIENFLQGVEPLSMDVILMTEVVFCYPGWRGQIKKIKEILRPEGILCIAFRPQYYDALNLVVRRSWESVDMLINDRSGNLYNESIEFTWQTSDEVRRLFREELDIELMYLVGIGCCSGIEIDPHSQIARPSMLGSDEIKVLMKLEVALAEGLPDAGRYMLAIARKKSGR